MIRRPWASTENERPKIPKNLWSLNQATKQLLWGVIQMTVYHCWRRLGHAIFVQFGQARGEVVNSHWAF